VWNFPVAAPVIEPLFKRDESEALATQPKLLITSQQANSLLFLSADASVDLDSPIDTETRRFDAEFARSLVAAHATAGDGQPSESDTRELIEQFRENYIASNEVLKANIDAVITQVCGNPLALAVIASTWRFRGFKARFWNEVSEALDY